MKVKELTNEINRIREANDLMMPSIELFSDESGHFSDGYDNTLFTWEDLEEMENKFKSYST